MELCIEHVCRLHNTLTDFLSILSMIVFSYMVELSIFFDCDIKMHENTTQLCLNQLRILKTLFFIYEKLSPGGARVKKFRENILKTGI